MHHVIKENTVSLFRESKMEIMLVSVVISWLSHDCLAFKEHEII